MQAQFLPLDVWGWMWKLQSQDPWAIRWHCGNDMQPTSISNEENDDLPQVFLVLIRRRRRRMVRWFKGWRVVGKRPFTREPLMRSLWFSRTQQFHEKIQRFKSAMKPGAILRPSLSWQKTRRVGVLERTTPLKSIFGTWKTRRVGESLFSRWDVDNDMKNWWLKGQQRSWSV